MGEELAACAVRADDLLLEGDGAHALVDELDAPAAAVGALDAAGLAALGAVALAVGAEGDGEGEGGAAGVEEGEGEGDLDGFVGGGGGGGGGGGVVVEEVVREG